ncbi:MAG TPA: FAD-dependent oxidoreductase [Kamptonema sp.]|nr:FAD-dependent oxidoreductase [Kamptonema sp.]
MPLFPGKFNPYRHNLQFFHPNGVEHDCPFDFVKLYSHPVFLKDKDRGGSRKHIAIIGGGIAGLTSAYELTQLDHQVTLLEASDLSCRSCSCLFCGGTLGN